MSNEREFLERRLGRILRRLVRGPHGYGTRTSADRDVSVLQLRAHPEVMDGLVDEIEEIVEALDDIDEMDAEGL